MKIYNYKDTEIAAIGDQLVTDIFGANRNKITSILINPIGEAEPVTTKFNRMIERQIYKRLLKKGLLEKGKYYE